jgi:murein DD-endopeptidase MepM/ murein hydrolase activator NlpD
MKPPLPAALRKLAAPALALLCFALPLSPSAAQEHYPVIERLQRSDLLFRQVIADINLFYRRQHSEGPLPPLAFYGYRVGEEESIFAIAARFNLPYDTLASLNGLANPDECTPGSLLIVPNRPGVFVPLRPDNALERLISGNLTRFDRQEPSEVSVQLPEGARRFAFFSDSRFNGTERSFFLHIFFRLPLPAGQITSGYGGRTSPISMRHHFHHGIDIAAPRGTEVYAAREGTVGRTGVNERLGTYVVIEHEGGFTSTYGHLSKKVVENGDQVHYGTIIGYVGSTGLSTGPHLHFEIRSGSESKDPLQLMPVRRK